MCLFGDSLTCNNMEGNVQCQTEILICILVCRYPYACRNSIILGRNWNSCLWIVNNSSWRGTSVLIKISSPNVLPHTFPLVSGFYVHYNTVINLRHYQPAVRGNHELSPTLIWHGVNKFLTLFIQLRFGWDRVSWICMTRHHGYICVISISIFVEWTCHFETHYL